jgi:hypothetical protein
MGLFSWFFSQWVYYWNIKSYFFFHVLVSCWICQVLNSSGRVFRVSSSIGVICLPTGITWLLSSPCLCLLFLFLSSLPWLKYEVLYWIVLDTIQYHSIYYSIFLCWIRAVRVDIILSFLNLNGKCFKGFFSRSVSCWLSTCYSLLRYDPFTLSFFRAFFFWLL